MDHINEEELLAQLRESIAALAEQEELDLSEEQLDELAASALDEHMFDLSLDEHFEEVLGEEYTQLDELDKKTLKSYVKKATTSSDRHWAKAEKEEDKAMSTNGEKYPEKQRRHMDAANASIKTWQKRGKGIEAAKKKLSEEELDEHLQEVLGEEFEELTEISKKTLGSYIQKATADHGIKMVGVGSAGERGNYDKVKADAAKAAKRLGGVSKAVKKLTKESADEILAFAAEGKTVELGDAFASAMSAHLADRLDGMRQDVASRMFNAVAGE